jgi:hypothetical protein
MIKNILSETFLTTEMNLRIEGKRSAYAAFEV